MPEPRADSQTRRCSARSNAEKLTSTARCGIVSPLSRPAFSTASNSPNRPLIKSYPISNACPSVLPPAFKASAIFTVIPSTAHSAPRTPTLKAKPTPRSTASPPHPGRLPAVFPPDTHTNPRARHPRHRLRPKLQRHPHRHFQKRQRTVRNPHRSSAHRSH